MSKSQWEEGLATQIKQVGLPEPEREYRFARPLVGDSPEPPAKPGIRKRLAEAGLKDWQFDFAWPEHNKLAVEIEGGVWTRGRHTRGSGFVADCVKYNKAVEHGWRVLRFPPEHIQSGLALNQIERCLCLNTRRVK